MNNAESEDEEPLSKVPQKRKENTDCHNMAFDQAMKDRRQNQSQDFSRVNKTKLKLMSHGRLPQPRIDLPDNVETFQYSSQQLNIWEF